MAMSAEERRRRGVISSQKWRAKNLDRALAADRARRKRYYAANKDKVIAANEAWRKANPEKFKAAWQRRNAIGGRALRLRLAYGMTVEAWTVLFESQGKACALCRTGEPGGRRGWHTDHDHGTGLVRGILCHRCNTGLGLLGDSLTALTAAVEYLRR